MATDKWQFDALKLQIGFCEYENICKLPNWTESDAVTMEHYCNALMQLTRQMDAGQRPKSKDECGDLVSFDDIPQVLNQIAVCAVRMVLSGAHKTSWAINSGQTFLNTVSHDTSEEVKVERQ